MDFTDLASVTVTEFGVSSGWLKESFISNCKSRRKIQGEKSCYYLYFFIFALRFILNNIILRLRFTFYKRMLLFLCLYRNHSALIFLWQ